MYEHNNQKRKIIYSDPCRHEGTKSRTTYMYMYIYTCKWLNTFGTYIVYTCIHMYMYTYNKCNAYVHVHVHKMSTKTYIRTLVIHVNHLYHMHVSG